MPACPAVAACACARPGCGRPRRYPSDTRDEEWTLLAPLLPVPSRQTPAGGHQARLRFRLEHCGTHRDRDCLPSVPAVPALSRATGAAVIPAIG